MPFQKWAGRTFRSRTNCGIVAPAINDREDDERHHEPTNSGRANDPFQRAKNLIEPAGIKLLESRALALGRRRRQGGRALLFYRRHGWLRWLGLNGVDHDRTTGDQKDVTFWKAIRQKSSLALPRISNLLRCIFKLIIDNFRKTCLFLILACRRLKRMIKMPRLVMAQRLRIHA